MWDMIKEDAENIMLSLLGEENRECEAAQVVGITEETVTRDIREVMED